MNNERAIVTEFIHPPIPLRCHDWCATFDGHDNGDLVGYGETEEEAKADLIQQAEEQ